MYYTGTTEAGDSQRCIHLLKHACDSVSDAATRLFLQCTRDREIIDNRKTFRGGF